jgi:diguanylate cyclase (GGDEF)-like protein
MRIARKELLLIAGLMAAMAVAFSDQVIDLSTATSGAWGARHIAFLPGLAFMAVVLLVYVQTKRQEVEVLAAEVADEARQAQERASELERLVAFWKALTQSLDLDAVRETVAEHLPDIARSAETWLVTGEGGTWMGMFGPATVRTSRGETAVTGFALDVLAQPDAAATSEGIECDGQVCFPLIAAGATLGALGVPASDVSASVMRRQVIGAAAALIAVAVRSANLLRDLRENTLRDSLTGCSTRVYALEMATAELKRAGRSQLPISLLMMDIDHFKLVNDRYGHLCGDAVLAAVGATIRTTFRSSDVKCRYGGEEFLVLLPDTPTDGAVRAAELMRTALADLEIPWHGQTIRVTSSFGVATARAGEFVPTPLIARADAALYLAKREGRNCVRVEDDAPAARAAAN